MSILITGASGGLGSAVVKAFLATGAQVSGVGRSWPAAAVSVAGLRKLTADLTNTEDCSRVVQEAGEVDALVHLAGAFAGGKPVSGTDDKTWEGMLDINLSSAFRMFRAVLPGMLRRKRGCILAVGSRAALEPMANFAAYSVSKAALVALVQATALETKKADITANAVLPSIIDTPANREVMPQADTSAWVTPEAIADLLVWLASPAGRNVSGAAIPIYGRA